VGRVALGASLAASALLVAGAGAVPGLAWLAWVGLLPLFLAIRLLSAVGASLAGALWGGCVWVFSTTLGGGAIAPALGSFLLLLTVPAVYAYLGGWVTRRLGFSPLYLALGWVGVELALSPLGLRYGLLAGVLGGGTLVQVVGGLLGYAMLAFLIALVNAAVLATLEEVGRYWGRPRFVTHSDDDRGWLITLTTSCVPVSAPRPAGPRAPPA